MPDLINDPKQRVTITDLPMPFIAVNFPMIHQEHEETLEYRAMIHQEHEETLRILKKTFVALRVPSWINP